MGVAGCASARHRRRFVRVCCHLADADALRGLFDPHLSAIELVRMEAVDEASFVAHWRLHGALKLPWRPSIKPYAGATLYELDAASGLIVSHTETWSISAVDAFVSTAWPGWPGAAPAAPSAAAHEYVTPPPPRLHSAAFADAGGGGGRARG
jgi:hypothetical protein